MTNPSRRYTEALEKAARAEERLATAEEKLAGHLEAFLKGMRDTRSPDKGPIKNSAEKAPPKK